VKVRKRYGWLLMGGALGLVVGLVVMLGPLAGKLTEGEVMEKKVGFGNIVSYPEVKTQSLFEDEGEVMTSLMAPEGVSGEQVLEHYKSEFLKKGWEVVEEGESDILAEDSEGNMYRVWIYFSGGDGENVIYNVDYVLVGGEMLPIPVQ